MYDSELYLDPDANRKFSSKSQLVISLVWKFRTWRIDVFPIHCLGIVEKTDWTEVTFVKLEANVSPDSKYFLNPTNTDFKKQKTKGYKLMQKIYQIT